MKKVLAFRNYDQAIMFKVLNDLPKDTLPIAESFKRTTLVRKGKTLKMNVTNMEGKEWLL
jgi:hypothetical protein